MMIQLLQENPGRYVAIVLVVIVSIVLHELAHGWAAIWQGDRTPIESGHMTLNPVVHMGGVSLALLAVVGIAFGAMPVNPSRFRSKYGDVWVALAGPAMNLVLAVIGLIGLGLMFRFAHVTDESPVAGNAAMLLWELATMNFALFLFNLLPVPPLDGSHILAGLVPAYRRLMSADFARGAMVAVFFALFLGGAQWIRLAADTATIGGLWAIAKVTG